MEALEVRYALTADGVDIAYATMGHGPPVVLMPDGHLAWTMAPEIPEWSPFFDGLAADHTLVLIDSRGFGNSDQKQLPDHPGKILLDIVAVLDRLDLSPAALVARSPNAPLALRLAVERPHAFSHLVLLHPLLRYRRLLESGFSRINRAAVETSYDFWLNSMVVSSAGNLCDTSRSRLRAICRLGSREAILALMEAYAGVDGADFAPRVTTPTLVIQRDSTLQTLPAEHVREVVAAIPGARLVRVTEGGWPTCDDPAGETLHAIKRFLGDDAGPALGPAAGFRTILFTDVVSSTPLLAQLKDERMRAVMHGHDEVLAAAVARHSGRVVKTIGDAFMAEFAVPSAALEAAIAAQRGIRERFAAGDVPIRLRIGINAGEPIEEAGDLHGASVVIAKRLESAAGDSGILVSDVVKQAVAGKDFEFEDRGLLPLKGFDEPVRAWAVRWD